MKIGVIFFLTVIETLYSGSFKQNKDSNAILGEWYYQNSLIEDKPIRLSTNQHCPVFKMYYTECSDSAESELKKMPVYVKEARKNNFFENIKCQTFDHSGKKIDTYYPVSSEKGENLGVIDYGLVHKSFYTIDMISNDTLIIFNGEKYTIEGESYTGIRHIYTKNKIPFTQER